ncbi:hypothetical protein TRSC58_07381 [Trypanosoma rangeli SC58]|uniref:Uncharacterized protein n=1 Tax=Trypanosoma rangeli SC58 TaxID=429131 RepID=A0A061IVG2_TRYRA|nr:hypothetical protein TRSC58_07381 [Trypanosoma rangeli SC58]
MHVATTLGCKTVSYQSTQAKALFPLWVAVCVCVCVCVGVRGVEWIGWDKLEVAVSSYACVGSGSCGPRREFCVCARTYESAGTTPTVGTIPPSPVFSFFFSFAKKKRGGIVSKRGEK